MDIISSVIPTRLKIMDSHFDLYIICITDLICYYIKSYCLNILKKGPLVDHLNKEKIEVRLYT